MWDRRSPAPHEFTRGSESCVATTRPILGVVKIGSQWTKRTLIAFPGEYDASIPALLC